MKTFNFNLDTKITTWMRTTFEIEAKNLEEAKKKAIRFHNKGNTASIGWDENMDTQEQMRVEDNGGEPTEEILLDNGECIWDNTI